MKKRSVSYQFILVVMLILGCLLAVNIGWNMKTRYDKIVANMRDKAYVLSKQMEAVWQFVEVNQDLINTDKSGSYEFKRLHCAIVGKSVGAIFSKSNDLVSTHYTNLKTRNYVDAPDSFETEALLAFQADPNLKEYFEVTDLDGKPVFRYLSVLTVKESCLECHGEPKGIYDKTGYPKEGWKVGDMGGAVSMVLNIDADLVSYEQEKVRDMFFLLVTSMAVCAVLYLAVRRFVVRPLKSLEQGVLNMSSGDLSTRVDEQTLEHEFLYLGQHFNEMSEKLERAYSSMEEQVQERTEELEEANELLQRANELLKQDVDLKDNFLSMMSHELKTPLTAILAFAEVLKKHQTEPRELRAVEEIENNSRFLLTMINNTLEMARIEAGKSRMNCEWIDPGDLIEKIESTIAPLAVKKQITFTTSVDREVSILWGDWDKLLHIIENLCSNAVKFTEEFGHIWLNIRRDLIESCIKIEVEDDGVGIPEEMKMAIFEKFVQIDSSASRRYNGSGLGLAIAKQLAQMHGGDIFVESEEGRGSRFVVVLPQKEEAEE